MAARSLARFTIQIMDLNIQNQPKPRIVIPAAMAILLTFGRSGMLPFEAKYTLLDQAMNLFVVIISPIFFLKSLFPHPVNHNLRFIVPFALLATWITACVLIGSPSEYWPSQTPIITIILSVLLATQVTRFELQRLRHFVLLLTGVFNLYVLIFAQSSLNLIFSGSLNERLGIQISSANVIIFPRVMCMLVITCLISTVIEKKLWLRVGSAIILILPLLITLATGGRGPLVALVLASMTVALFMKKRIMLYAGWFIVVVAIGYRFTVALFPTLLAQRIAALDSGRMVIWKNALTMDNISLFGKGISAYYPHNIFIEMLINFGIIGLLFFLLFLTTSINTAYKYYTKTSDIESLWVISLIILQLIAQQLSLDIFYGGFWAAMLLPLGYGWQYSQNNLTRKST